MASIRSALAALLAITGCASQQPGSEASSDAEGSNPYNDLRDMALAASVPGVSPPSALMELGLGDATATVVAVADGATSLYLSNGGGIIGAGEHEPVREASAEFLRTAGGLASRMEPTTDRPLPSAGHVRFYVVTADGVRTAEAEEAALAGGSHPLSALYAKGQDVLTAVREADSRR